MELFHVKTIFIFVPSFHISFYNSFLIMLDESCREYVLKSVITGKIPPDKSFKVYSYDGVMDDIKVHNVF